MKKFIRFLIVILFCLFLSNFIVSCKNKHEHSYSFEHTTTQHRQVCECGEQIPLEDHIFGNWEVIKEATEKEMGSRIKKCIICSFEVTEDIPVLSHTHVYADTWTVDVIPSCTEAGSESRHCMTCDNKINIRKLPALGHTPYDTWKTEQEATCTVEGRESLICKVCNETIASRTIEKRIHQYTNYIFSGDSHWKQCNYCQNRIEVQQHNFNKNICSICKYDRMKCNENLEFILNEDQMSYSVRGIDNLLDTKVFIPFKYNNLPVTGILDGAFKDAKIEEIYLTENLISIGDFAFIRCYELREIYFPNSLMSIGERTFEGCNKLHYIQSGNGLYLGSSDNPYFALIKIEQGATECEIHHDTKIYAKNVFLNAKKLQCISIPENSTNIEGLFDNCNSLYKFIVPISKLDSLPKNKVIEIELKGCETIPTESFAKLPNLKKIILPDSINNIEFGAFLNCPSLESITLPFAGASLNETENTHFGYIFGANTYSDNSQYVPNGLKEVVITGGTIIGERAFSGCSSLTSIIIPDSVVSIGKDSFFECSSLQIITLPFVGAKLNGTENTHFGYIFGATTYSDNSKYVPSSLQKVIITGGESLVESFTFSNCSSLTSITILDGVTSIGDYAFYNCSRLTSITIGNSVTSIGKYAFKNCSNLMSITLPFVGAKLNGTENTHFGYIFGATTYSDNSKYVPSSLQEVIITGGESLESFTFSHCSMLTNITIPESVTSIGMNAFIECDNLKNVYYEGSIEQWCGISFKGNAYGNPMIYASHFYQKNNLNDWEEVTSIEIPNTITEIKFAQFYGFSNIKYINIPNSVIVIKKSAFANCSSLTSITILDGVTSIGDYAFSGCSSLTSITIPDSVTSIGESAFSGCSSLTSITIPDSVTSIGESAFSGCSNLISIYYKGPQAEWGNITIEDSSGLTAASTTIYYYSETKPTDTANSYWHYDKKGNICIWK